jgi:hypothetical protein
MGRAAGTRLRECPPADGLPPVWLLLDFAQSGTHHPAFRGARRPPGRPSQGKFSAMRV